MFLIGAEAKPLLFTFLLAIFIHMKRNNCKYEPMSLSQLLISHVFNRSLRCQVKRKGVDGKGTRIGRVVVRAITRECSVEVSVCGLAGARNGRTGRTRPINPSHSEDSVAETALSKKNSDGKKTHAGLATIMQIVS